MKDEACLKTQRLTLSFIIRSSLIAAIRWHRMIIHFIFVFSFSFRKRMRENNKMKTDHASDAIGYLFSPYFLSQIESEVLTDGLMKENKVRVLKDWASAQRTFSFFVIGHQNFNLKERKVRTQITFHLLFSFIKKKNKLKWKRKSIILMN